jgi:stage II sporulation protein D
MIRLFLKYFLFIFFVSSSITVQAKPPEFLDINRIIRVGLVSLRLQKSVKIIPSNGFIEIFDNKKKKAVYTGKASKLKVSYVKASTMKVEIDGKKNFLNLKGELLFSSVGKPPNFISIEAGRKKRSYRGSLAITTEGRYLRSINQVDIEDYLKSVVPSEIFNRGPAATLESQAIAARTYAVRNINRHRKKHDFDLCDTVHCQVYTGMVREIKSTTQAVMNTQGRVLVFRNELANTVYHSNCGGIIICSTAAWGGKPVPYLVSHRDGIKGQELFCSIGKKVKTNKTKNLKLPKPVKNLIVKSFPAKTRKRYHKHFGHRVGMCQDGAIGMGTIGYTHRQILGFYYPGTALATLKYAIPKPELPPEPEPIVVAFKPKESKQIQAPLKLLSNPTQDDAIKRARLITSKNSSVKSALKEVSTSSSGSNGGLRRLFWNSGQPELYRQTNIFNSRK